MEGSNDPIREGFIYRIGELAASMGLSRSVGQLYALLYMSAGPLCLDEMARSCEMSKASASTNIRELERWGAARRVWVPGDRKDYYEANREVAQIVIRRLTDGLGRRLGLLQAAIDEASERVGRMDQAPETAAFYKERLKEVRKLHGSLQRALDNLGRIYQVARRFL